MSLGSTTAKNISLDACYGSGKAAAWPATVYVALFAGDPAGAGTEVTGGGYARTAVTNNDTNWPVAAGGAKSNGTDVAFPASTGAWTGTATHVALMSASSGGNVLDAGAISSSVTVSGSGTVVRFTAGTLTITAA